MWQRIQAFYEKYPWRIKGSLIALFVILGWIATKNYRGIPATEWMRIYSHRDFPNILSVLYYMRDLRTGVAPALSFMELLSFQFFGTLEPVIHYLYRIGIIGGSILPFFLTKRSFKDLVFALVLGWIMLASTLVIHKANPQLYDVLLPFFLLLYVLFSRISFQKKMTPKAGVFFAILAGLFLSMAELSRPFMIAIVPFLIAYNVFHYRKGPTRRLIYFPHPHSDYFCGLACEIADLQRWAGHLV